MRVDCLKLNISSKYQKVLQRIKTAYPDIPIVFKENLGLDQQPAQTYLSINGNNKIVIEINPPRVKEMGIDPEFLMIHELMHHDIAKRGYEYIIKGLYSKSAYNIISDGKDMMPFFLDLSKKIFMDCETMLSHLVINNIQINEDGFNKEVLERNNNTYKIRLLDLYDPNVAPFIFGPSNLPKVINQLIRNKFILNSLEPYLYMEEAQRKNMEFAFGNSTAEFLKVLEFLKNAGISPESISSKNFLSNLTPDIFRFTLEELADFVNPYQLFGSDSYPDREKRIDKKIETGTISIGTMVVPRTQVIIPPAVEKVIKKETGMGVADLATNVLNETPAKKVGRNDPCPCGSGKKYKKCCLSK